MPPVRSPAGLLRCALALACASLATPAVASARGLTTAVTTAGPFMASDAESAQAYRQTRATGIKAVRIYLSWAGTAPRQEPSSWSPSNPSDPNYYWYTDRDVRRAVEAGLEPILCVSDAPTWAEAATGGPAGTNSPDPAALGRFVNAAARRYSGAVGGLPAVRYWEVWNEPNASYFLNPQREAGQNVSPDLYRRMVNASARAVRGVSGANRVVAGSTFAFDLDQGGEQAIGARRFLREVTRKKVRFDIWSVHPYTNGDAWGRAFGPDGASLGDLPAVRRGLDLIWRTGRISSRRRPALWVTEFQWDSSPPDPSGVPLELLTRWTAEALYQSWRSGVSLFTWFQLRDDPLGKGWQGGLYGRCAAGDCYAAKPILRAFRFPFVAYRRRSGMLVWGRTPGGVRGWVVVEQRRGARWARLATLRTGREGEFSGRLPLRGLGAVRARYDSESSAAFSLRVPATRPGITSFGS